MIGPDAPVGRSSSRVRPVVAGVLSAAAVGTVFAWSVLAEDLRRDLGATTEGLAAVFAAGLVAFTFALLLVGPLVDGSSPGRVLRVVACLAGASLGTMCVSRSLLVIGFGLAGLSVAGGVGYAVATGLAARQPPDERNTALAYVVAGYAAGPVLLGLVAPPLLVTFGWRWCVAGLSLLVTAALWASARWAPSSWPPVPSATRRAGPGAGTTSLLWLVISLGSVPGLAAFAHAVPLALEAGTSVRAAGAALSVLGAGSFAGRLLAGPVGRRTGARPALGAALVLDATAVALLGWAEWATALFAGFALLGMAYGAISAVLPAVTADICDSSVFGRTYGRIHSGWGVAGLLAPTVTASLSQSQGGLAPALRLTLISVLLAAVAFVILTRVEPGQSATASLHASAPRTAPRGNCPRGRSTGATAAGVSRSSKRPPDP